MMQMQRGTKRRWSARLLLCVFLPVLMLASVHVHRQAESVSAYCYECLHHLHHSAHLSSASITIDNCLLCHFLSTPYIAPTTVFMAVAVAIVGRLGSLSTARVTAASRGTVSLRAPPVCL